MSSPHKHCGRLDKHLGHHWSGSKVFDMFHSGYGGKWIRPIYWCTGFIKIEGGHHV